MFVFRPYALVCVGTAAWRASSLIPRCLRSDESTALWHRFAGLKTRKFSSLPARHRLDAYDVDNRQTFTGGMDARSTARETARFKRHGVDDTPPRGAVG